MNILNFHVERWSLVSEDNISDDFDLSTDNSKLISLHTDNTHDIIPEEFNYLSREYVH